MFIRCNQTSTKNNKKEYTKLLGYFRSNRPAVGHDSHNRSSACDLNQLLMPVKQNAHLLTTTTFTQVPTLNLGETTSALWGNRLAARRLRSTAGTSGRHSLVTVQN